jgi:bifunctional non-homologous end joining protein LigD
MAPFPRHISPMLAVLSSMPDDPSDFAFEYKWDGYRAVCYWDGRSLKFESRNLLDFTPRYPELQGLKAALKTPLVLDGEIVAFDEDQRPSFSLLQIRNGFEEGPKPKSPPPLVFMIFDLLFSQGRNLMNEPYISRRKRLEDLDLNGAYWQTPPSHVGQGIEMFEVAKEHGFEGLVAKRLDSLYLPGQRSPAWKKIKITKRQEFVVGGWTPERGVNDQGLGSLLLGVYEGKKLRYTGNVGTGFNESQRKLLIQILKKLQSPDNPFSERIPDRKAKFVTPQLVAEIEFRGWTGGEKIRQGSFKGLRVDKRVADVTREMAKR